MKENFPIFVKEIDRQVQGTQRAPDKMDEKGSTPRHIIIKMPKVKDKENLKSSKTKQRVTYSGVSIRLLADFSKETLQARRGWKEVLNVKKSKDLKPTLLCTA